ncbi:class F sortase [Modestobacter roseus]|nr:class F sortase [Modestobacter roseus]MQA33825.1 class F sortase [Modestobacter roseus]
MTGGRHRRPPSRMPARARLALAAVGVTAGAVALLSPTPATPARAAAPPAPVVVADTATATAPAPVRVRVPAIGVDSPVPAIGVDGDGALVPPADFTRAGWFAAGPAPGETGPAVLAGHVDDRSGPAVFFRLEELSAGDEVVVDRADGSQVTFTVTRVAAYPKTDFATAEVYGPTADAQLRLITCGGEFDRDRRSYTDNVVVYARLSS